MASATIASMAARMASAATNRAATIYSISRSGTGDGYGAAEELACNRAAVPISSTLGVHRFYTGRIISGIFQLLTFGGFGIWTLIDLIMIVNGDFKDKYNRPLDQSPVMGGSRSWVTAAFLCMFLGWLGVHRFYTGRVVSGIFQLLTFGGFGIWALIDLIMIYTDSFKDDMGLLLTRMERVGSNVYMYSPQVKD
jgi:TM2 domain-containing membrane protein YozV